MPSTNSMKACAPVSYQLNLTPVTAASLSRGDTECAKRTGQRTYAPPHNRLPVLAHKSYTVKALFAIRFNEREMAKALNIKSNMFWTWRRGKASPRLFMMERILDRLGYELVIRKKS